MRNLAFLITLSLASAPTVTGAANLLRNGSFDTDIAGWDVSGNCFPATWDSFDANGALAINCFNASMQGVVAQCVRVRPTDVDFSAQLSNNGAVGAVAFGLSSYASDDCSGAGALVVDPVDTATLPPPDCCGVNPVAFERRNLPLPATTHSVRAFSTVTTPADVALDDIRLSQSVFANGFEATP